jgi:hypothetical protein
VTDEEGRFATRRSSTRITGRGRIALPEAAVAPPFLLRVEGFVPRMVQVTEPGEVVVRMPRGALEIAVTSEGGEPLDFAYAVDGMCGRGLHGRLSLKGVEPGRRRLVIDARGHGARLVLVDVPEAGAKPVEVVLGRE